MNNKELDNKLRQIMKEIKPSWGGVGYKDTLMIKKAIKSKYSSVKMDTINKFR